MSLKRVCDECDGIIKQLDPKARTAIEVDGVVMDFCSLRCTRTYFFRRYKIQEGGDDVEEPGNDDPSEQTERLEN